MMSNNFGEILKNVRKEKGLKGLEFSKILGIPQSTLSKIERGKTKRIDPNIVCKIYQVFNIDANQLLGIEPKDNSIPMEIEHKDNSITNNYNISIQKAQELENALNYVREELQKLALQDKRIFEILDVIDSFTINTKLDNGRIQIICRKGIILVEGFFKENEMLYALVLMSFFSEFYYKCRKVVLKIQKAEYCVAIDALFFYVGRILREQVLYDVKPNMDFQTEQFYKEFKELIEVAVNSLGDQIGHLTKSHNSQEADELKDIRAIYETITFEGKTIKYYDYIAKIYKTINIHNTVEIQYMLMNLYAKAYAESVLLLEKEVPSGQWFPATPWQIIMKMRIIIPKYFIETKGSL